MIGKKQLMFSKISTKKGTNKSSGAVCSTNVHRSKQPNRLRGSFSLSTKAQTPRSTGAPAPYTPLNSPGSLDFDGDCDSGSSSCPARAKADARSGPGCARTRCVSESCSARRDGCGNDATTGVGWRRTSARARRSASAAGARGSDGERHRERSESSVWRCAAVS